MRLRVVAAVGVLAVAGGLATPGTAWASAPAAWNRVFQARTQGLITSIAAISKNDSWAVGELFAGSGATRYQPFVRHYDGSSWKAVTIPGARFSSQWVAASSAKNVWVFGFTPNAQDIANSTAYRYDGSHWHKVPVPALTDLRDPVVLSPASVWAFGSSGSLSLPGDVFHWNGTRWQDFNLNLYPQALSASAASNVWVTGLTFTSPAQKVTAYRWNGRRWLPVSMPHPVPAQSPGVTASSASDVWIGWDTATTARGMHWDGHRWHVITAPGNVIAEGYNIVPDGHGGDWFGPFGRWTGRTWTGAFDVSPGFSAGGFGPVVRVPGTSSFWLAAGVKNTASSIEEPTIYRYDLSTSVLEAASSTSAGAAEPSGHQCAERMVAGDPTGRQLWCVSAP